MKETIYLDHAATTPMAPEVIDVMTKALNENYGNASSIHLGKKNRVDRLCPSNDGRKYRCKS